MFPAVGEYCCESKNPAEVVDVVRNVSRYFCGDSFIGTHTATTVRALHLDFFFCFDLATAFQFVKCEGKIGQSPSAAAVMD